MMDTPFVSLFDVGQAGIALVGVSAKSTLRAVSIFDSGAVDNEIKIDSSVNEQGIRLEFAQFGHFTSFDVIRSMVSMTSVADEDLPTPIATGLKTMYYVDRLVVEGATYYYKVRVWRGTESFTSDQLMVETIPDEHWANVVSFLDFESDLTDKKGVIWAQTNPQPVHSGVQVNSVDTSISSSNNLLNNSEIYTIEAIVEFNTFPSTGGFWERSVVYGKTRNSASGEFGLFFENDGALVLDLRGIGASYYTSTLKKSIVANQQVHVAHTYDGSKHRVFVDGVKFLEVAVTNSYPAHNNSEVFRWGALLVPNYLTYASWINGVFKYTRITKGIARYIDPFTPPQKLLSGAE